MTEPPPGSEPRGGASATAVGGDERRDGDEVVRVRTRAETQDEGDREGHEKRRAAEQVAQLGVDVLSGSNRKSKLTPSTPAAHRSQRPTIGVRVNRASYPKVRRGMTAWAGSRSSGATLRTAPQDSHARYSRRSTARTYKPGPYPR